jgi:hypothetical protein
VLGGLWPSLKGATPIDILALVDRLEEVLDRGWRLPLGKKVVIDEDMFLNIMDQMRISIPQEIKQAQEIQQEKDKYIAQANDEARRIIAQAREDAAKQLDEHKLRQEAEIQAEAIIRRAQQEGAQLRAGADEYAEIKLREFGQHISKLQVVIQNALDALQSRRAQQLKEAPSASQGAPTGSPGVAQGSSTATPSPKRPNDPQPTR